MSLLDLLRDPPPEVVFEIAADGIAMSRTRPPLEVRHVPLQPGVLAPSPVKENILDLAAFTEAVRQLTPKGSGRGKRRAALVLPANSVRIVVLDFDNLPEKEEERRQLISFRLRKSIPFDVDEAALSYFPQPGKKVIVAVAPAGIIEHYEAPFRAAGWHPGLVTVSSLAMLDLLPVTGSIVLAHLSAGMLTVIATSGGVVTIVRSIEIGDEAGAGEPRTDQLEEVIAAVFPTLAFIEDQTQSRPEKLYIAGFSQHAINRLAVELDIPVEPIHEAWPGLAGYLASVAPLPRPIRKKAAA
jgi:type IV pilus assembly protein PilM